MRTGRPTKLMLTAEERQQLDYCECGTRAHERCEHERSVYRILLARYNAKTQIAAPPWGGSMSVSPLLLRNALYVLDKSLT
jgi:hypothetical protein